MIMIGSVNDETATSKMFQRPYEIGGAERQSSCLIVSDIDGIYVKAKAAGAKMVQDIGKKSRADRRQVIHLHRSRRTSLARGNVRSVGNAVAENGVS